MRNVVQLIDTLRQDVRFAVRQLARRPLFSAAAVLTLALGMSLNAVVFSGVNALFLKGNAMSDVDGAWIVTTSPQGGTNEVSLAEFDRLPQRHVACSRRPSWDAFRSRGSVDNQRCDLGAARLFGVLQLGRRKADRRPPSTASKPE